jgi:hypothetical protein
LDPKLSILENTLGSERSNVMPETVEMPVPVDEPEIVPMWELAECTCPDWCERDHEQD